MPGPGSPPPGGGRSPAPRNRPPATLRWRRARRLGRLASLAAFLGFTLFLGRELRESFARRGAPPTTGQAQTEEPDEVVSRALEATAFDSDGAVVEIRAAEALGHSEGRQRLLDAEVRLAGADEGRDVVLAADELILDIGGSIAVLDFIGNAVLRTERLELAGPHLRFRGAPNRLWSIDPVQFATEDLIGIAAGMQFRVGTGEAHLQGVTAGPPPGKADPGAGVRISAGRAHFDPWEGVVTLEEEPHLTSGRLELRSRSPVLVRRDLERSQTRSVESGFGTEVVVHPPGSQDTEPGAGATSEAMTPAVTLHSDLMEIELGPAAVPATVRATENVVLARGDTELRAERARLQLTPEGSTEHLELNGSVEARLETASGGRLVFLEAERMETGFRSDGGFGAADFSGGVSARMGSTTSTSETARWNGRDTLELEGEPALTDPALLDLESPEIRLTLGSESRVRARSGVMVRFAPGALGWLPGKHHEAALTADRADLSAGSGKARFQGGVRLRFGPNRVSSGGLEVDAEAGKLVAAGGVDSALEFPRPASSEEPAPADGEERPAPVAAGPSAAEDGEVRAPGAAPEPFAFRASANLMAYDAATSRLSWRGVPRLIHRFSEDDPSELIADRLDAAISPDGAASAVTAEGDARFEWEAGRIEGARIRYRPGLDELEAWGAPAVMEADSRRSEGGWLRVGLSETKSRIHPRETRRVETRVKVRRPGGDDR